MGELSGIHTHFAIAAQHDGLHIARIHFVQANQFAGGAAELIGGEGKVHAIDLAGVMQPLHVLAQAKNSRAAAVVS